MRIEQGVPTLGAIGFCIVESGFFYQSVLWIGEESEMKIVSFGQLTVSFRRVSADDVQIGIEIGEAFLLDLQQHQLPLADASPNPCDEEEECRSPFVKDGLFFCKLVLQC